MPAKISVSGQRPTPGSPSVLCLLSLFARAVLKSSTLAPAPSTTPPSSKSWMRNENPATLLLPPIPSLPPAEKRKPRPAQFAPKVARRWNVARAVLFHLSLMRNAHSILLSRGYRGGRRPRRTLKGGRGGTIVGSPRFFRFLSSEKGRIKKQSSSLYKLKRNEFSA